MAEEQVQEVVQVVAETPENETPSIETLVASEVEKVSAQYKKELQGLNRRNTELEQVLDAQKKMSMDEKERLQYELEQRENAIAAKEQEIVRATNKDKAFKFSSDNSIPNGMLDALQFDNWDVVESNLNILKAVVDSDRKRIIEEFKTSSGHSPAPGGGSPKGMINQAQLHEMSPAEVTLALKEGRVTGFGKL